MGQRIIAMIWDFDKTLIKDYMQVPIFKKYNVDGSAFWTEVSLLYKKYLEAGVKVNKDTIYLNHLITCVQQGVFPGLNNSVLRELGNELLFYNGLPDFFKTIKDDVVKHEKFKKYNIAIEHYIVSTGFSEMIRGSLIADYVDGIWGCEFIEEPILSNLKGNPNENKPSISSMGRVITQIGDAIDNTTKTRAIFEINKGINKYDQIDVNSQIPNEARRVPIENMIYIADGPSDVPAFSVVKQNGGTTFAVYEKNSLHQFNQVEQLRKDNRVDFYGEADYTDGTITHMWLAKRVTDIANKIYENAETEIFKRVSKPPSHINE